MCSQLETTGRTKRNTLKRDLITMWSGKKICERQIHVQMSSSHSIWKKKNIYSVSLLSPTTVAYTKKASIESLQAWTESITSLWTFNSYSEPINGFILCTSKNPPCSSSSLQLLSYFTTQQAGSQNYLNLHLHQQFHFLFSTFYPTTPPLQITSLWLH